MGRYYSGDIEGKFWFTVQSSDDADFFGVEGEYVYPEGEDGEPDESMEPMELSYYFTPDDTGAVEDGIETCIEKLGDSLHKLDDFFGKVDGYNDIDIAVLLNIDKSEVKSILEWYARLKLGKKIRWSLQANAQCNFTCEL
jgi:hypothetical protein